MFWGNQIKGKKGRTQRPLKAADSSLDMCLKRDAAGDAKKRGKDGGERENGERPREGRKERSRERWAKSKGSDGERGQAAQDKREETSGRKRLSSR